jgi:hypothetical protein
MDPKPAWEGAHIPDIEQYGLLFFQEITKAEFERGEKIEW